MTNAAADRPLFREIFMGTPCIKLCVRP
jgi:hypothetical protein